jgi:antitoxin MazE
MRTKIVKWGNSLGLRIPKSFADEVQVTDGSAVELTLEDGQLVIRVAREPEYALDELLSGITDENLHAEVDAGDAVGGEAW